MQRIKNGLVTWVASSVTRWSSRWTSPWLVSNCSRNLNLISACENFWRTVFVMAFGKVPMANFRRLLAIFWKTLLVASFETVPGTLLFGNRCLWWHFFWNSSYDNFWKLGSPWCLACSARSPRETSGKLAGEDLMSGFTSCQVLLMGFLNWQKMRLSRSKWVGNPNYFHKSNCRKRWE